MIDTLFYFVDTEQEYRRQMQGPDGKPGISPTTIVFVGDSREIYVNGKGYGKTSTNGLLASSEFDQWKSQLNERIDNVISGAASANAEARQKAEADLAAAMASIEAALDDTSGDINADILAVRQQIQQAKTELQTNIDSANLNADEILSELTTFQGTIRNELETSIRDAITNANGRTIWSELNTTNEGITAMTNRIDQSLNPDGSIKSTDVLQSIIDSGVRNNTAITDIQSKWAVLDENQDVIEWVASGFQSQAHNEGGLAAMFATAQNDTLNAIASMKTEIEQDVAGNYVANADVATHVRNTVKTDLGLQETDSLSAIALQSNVDAATTTITNRLNTVDQTTGAIQTSLAQVASTATEGKARASLLTSVDNNGAYIINESNLDSAMVDIFTNHEGNYSSSAMIHTLAQEDIAEANIAAQIETATAVLATKAELNSATAALEASLENELSTGIAGVQANVDTEKARVTQLAEWQSGIDTWKSGVVTESNKDGAVAALIAEGANTSTKNNVKAAVVATVNNDGDSAIKISADHIFMDANKTNTIRSKFNSLDNTIGGLAESIAALTTDASAQAATLSALTSWKDNEEYKAGLVAESGLDGAMAALIATDGTGARSQITTIVNNGLSTLTLSADKVYIEGNQNVNIKSYFDGEIDSVESDIDALEETVSGHTTSIASLNTKADNNKSSIDAITTWKDGFVTSYASGLQTEAGLDGAVANLFAENANTNAKAGVKAVVQGEASSLTLSAGLIYLDANRTVANTIEAIQGHIGGINIGENSISSANNNFSISSGGKLVAKDAEITGKITATQLTLSGVSVPASSVSGLSAVATSGSYSSLSGTPSLSAVATSGSYADLSNKPTIPSNITDLTGGANVLHSTDISTTETTRSDGTKVKTITVGDKTYTTISDNNGFIYTNVGLGTKNNTYTKISSNGLLEADNAIIHGTVYATAGSFTGDVVANTLTAGDTNSMYIQTSANAINFVSKGSDGNLRPVAKFESDGNGLFFSVMDEHGDAYSMDWSMWKVTKGDYEDLDVNRLYMDEYARTFYEQEPTNSSGQYTSGKLKLCTKNGVVYTNYKYDAVDNVTRGTTPTNGSASNLKKNDGQYPSACLYGKRIGTLKDIYPNSASGSVVYVINPFYKITVDPQKDDHTLYYNVTGRQYNDYDANEKPWYPNVVVEIPIDQINVYRLAHVENATLSWLDKYLYTTSYITPHITNFDNSNVGLRNDRKTDVNGTNNLENLSLSGSMTFDSYGYQLLSKSMSREANGRSFKPCEMVLCEYSSNFSAHIVEKQINDISGNTDRRHIRSHITYNSPVTIPASSLMYFAVGVEASSTYGMQWTSDNTSSMKYDQVNLTPVAAGTYW